VDFGTQHIIIPGYRNSAKSAKISSFSLNSQLLISMFLSLFL